MMHLSMLDEGIVYRHPERRETAIVWADSEDCIKYVLRYHYSGHWSDLKILKPNE
jgi:hypothetical protein